MSKWLEKQLRYNSQLVLPKSSLYTIRTNNITLWNLLNRLDYREEIQKDIAKKINQNFDFGEFLIKELVKEYKRITGRDSEWGISWHSPKVGGDWQGHIYLFPTPKEVNLKIKTKRWEWSQDMEGMGIKTARHWWHISCFSPKGWNPRVFIRVGRVTKEDSIKTGAGEKIK